MNRSAITMAACLLAACAPGPAPETRPRGLAAHRDVVLLDELSSVSERSNLYDALERIRPTMVHPRQSNDLTSDARGKVDVFIDGTWMGGIDMLQLLRPTNVASVRMRQYSDAYTEYGSWLKGQHALFVTLVK